MKHSIEIPQNSSSVTMDSVYSAMDKENVTSITVGNVQYEIVNWGYDNKLPYQLKKQVEWNSVMSQNKFFNVLTSYGRGIEYMDVESMKEKQHAPSMETDVREFVVRNNLKRFFAEQLTDLKYFYFCVCVLILNRDRTKVVRIVHKDATSVRFQKPDARGRIKNIFFADWESESVPEHIERISLLDEVTPLDDLRARCGDGDPLGQFYKSPKNETKFAIVCKIPTPGCNVYPVPYWTAVLRDGWYDIYQKLTQAKLAKVTNGQNIRYHVEINTQFWEARAAEQGIMLQSKEFVEMKASFIEELKNYLSGSKNSDKLLWSEFDSLMSGDERHYLKISVVDTSKAGNEYNDDIAEASNILCYDDNVHPNLAGATPGKSQMNNSGSDKRELFTMKQALETLPHDMMMTVHNTVIFFNGWGQKAFPEVPIIMLTTLDKNTDAKEVSINNNQPK